MNHQVIRTSLVRVTLLALATSWLGACSSTPERPSAHTDKLTANEARRAADYARRMVGVRYRYGGNTPKKGFDCSGLVQYSFSKAGQPVPRNTTYQYRNSYAVRRSELRKGDLLFFNQLGKRLSHVGIYLGEGKFVHAPSSGKHVRVSDLKNPYWRKHLASTRRFY